ncbi:MAG: hypothetical protein KatS3mg025_0053 [Bacteroidia bacterium]|nr:MAG: hypothetical protein KatS3mg025_0053 [Bacteroidia bacterium]
MPPTGRPAPEALAAHPFYLSLPMRLLLLSLLSLGAFAQTWYETDLPKAFAKAKKQKKPLWIMFSATWCGPCKLVEAKVLSSPTFQEAVTKDFIPLHVYVQSGEEDTPGADTLAKRIGVAAYPTFVCMEANGSVFYRQEGISSEVVRGTPDDAVKEFLQQLSSAKEARTTLPQLRARFQKGDRSLPFLREYLTLLIKVKQKTEMDTVFSAYLRAAGSTRAAWLPEPGFFLNLLYLVMSFPEYTTYVMSIADTLRQELDSASFLSLYQAVVAVDFEEKQAKIKDWKALVETTEVYIRRHRERFPFVEKLILQHVAEWGIGSKDPETREQAAALMIRAVAVNWPLEIPGAEEREDFAQKLNEAAWRFYEKVESPDKLWTAISWAKMAVALHPSAWEIWDTLGALYYKLKQKRHAIEALSKAIELAQKQGEEAEETKALLEKAKALSD